MSLFSDRDIVLLLRALRDYARAVRNHDRAQAEYNASEREALIETIDTVLKNAEAKACAPLIPVPEVAALVEQGSIVKATKLLRNKAGISLVQASRYVNDYAAAIAGKKS